MNNLVSIVTGHYFFTILTDSGAQAVINGHTLEVAENFRLFQTAFLNQPENRLAIRAKSYRMLRIVLGIFRPAARFYIR